MSEFIDQMTLVKAMAIPYKQDMDSLMKSPIYFGCVSAGVAGFQDHLLNQPIDALKSLTACINDPTTG